MSGSERYWQAHYDAHVPKTLDYPNETIYTLIERAASANPDRVALDFMGRETTYEELMVKVETFASALWTLGVRPKARVILLLPNCPQFVVAYLAILRLGATAVMANPLNVARELIFKFRDAEADTIIALDRLSGRVNEVKRDVNLKCVIYTGLQDELPFPLNLIFPIVANKTMPRPEIEKDGRTWRYKKLLKSASEAPPYVEIGAHPEDMAALIYSGGTTGVSKGIMLSNRALAANARQVQSWGDLKEDDAFLGVLPMFHGFGLSVGLNATLTAGGRLILLPRFEAKLMLSTIQRARPTFFAGVPTMYVALKEYKDFEKYDISSLRGMFCGAAPMPLEVMREFEQRSGAPLIEGYGLTEIVTAICCNPMYGERKPGTVGIPFPDIDAKIVSLEDSETEVGPGEAGELLIKGPDLMSGYLNKPVETAEAMKDGWLYTGDICTRDADGYISVVDRKKDLVIVSGFNVFPREIDEVLHEHPKVAEGIAVGLPHPTKGEYIKAYVTPRAGQTIEPEEIIAFCKERLTPYMVPKEVDVREELPKSMIGKVLRKELKAEEMKKQALKETN